MPDIVLPQIDILVDAGDWGETRKLERAIKAALSGVIGTGGIQISESMELSIVLTNDRSIQSMNAQWRGRNSPTNVLSFPVELFEAGGLPPELAMLGDIVLARETIEREAEDQGIGFADHLSHLVIHGFLHLLGYDHENDADARRMETLESEALALLGIADPYRTT